MKKLLLILQLLPLFQAYICIAQVNDSCANAIPLLVGQFCDPDTFSSAGATGEPSSVAPNPSCGFYKGGDVWFTVVMPASGALRYEVHGIAGITPQTAIYTGSCGAMTQLLCMQLYYVKTIVNPALAGQTLYIRIFNYNNATGGSFSICFWEPPVPENNDCANAIPLVTGENCEPVTYTNAYSTPEPASVSPNPSCGFYKGSDVWFYTTMPSSGALRIETSPTHAQSVLYAGTCGNMTQVVCNQLNQEKTISDSTLAGDTLYIRIFSYNSEDGAPFTLCVWEPEIPANDNCENPLPLTVGNECLPQQYTNANATAQPTTIVAGPSCGFYKGGDVWFTGVMPPTGKIIFHRNNISGVNAQWAVYSGTCGNFTQISCAQLTPNMVINNPALAGQTLFIRVFNYNSEEGGIFDFCVYDTTCINNSQTYNIYDTICEGENYLFPDESLITDITTNITDTAWLYNSLFCDSLLITHLQVSPVLPSPLLPADTLISCSIGNIILDAGNGYSSYHWNTGESSSQVIVSFPGIYSVTVTGCTEAVPSDSCSVSMTGPAIIGHLRYLNASSSPLAATIVFLHNEAGDIIDSAQTNNKGEYLFCNPGNGTFRLSAATLIPFGGINSIDAMQVLQYFAQLITLNGLKLQAADVNNSGNINSIDGLMIARRFVSLINTFPAGDWIFENPEFTVNEDEVTLIDFHGLCRGDVNGSYTP